MHVLGKREPNLPTALQQRMRARLEQIHTQALTRTLHLPAGVDFASNDYLGFSTHSDLPAYVAKHVARWELEHGGRRGLYGSTASRLLRGHGAVHEAIETRFSQFKGTEASLLCANGYMANLALLTSVVQPGDRVISDAQNHASIIDALRLSRSHRVIVPHVDANAIEDALKTHHAGGQTFVLTESLFSMDGDCAPLQVYAALCAQYGAALIVDDSHGTGVYGEGRCSGWIEQAGIGDQVAAVVSTCGKALGVFGAFVSGPRLVIDTLINTARPFIFTTAPPPHMALAIHGALDLLHDHPALRVRVHGQAERLRSHLQRAGFDTLRSSGPIVPVMIGDNQRAVDGALQLQKMGFDIRAIRPPTVAPGTARWRVCVHADHDDAVIDAVADAMGTVYNQMVSSKKTR